jgi:hypothetical protein
MRWKEAARAMRARGGRVKRVLRRRAESKLDNKDARPALEPRRAPGTARASMFFDAFPRFYETSKTGAFRGRLNMRYEAIFGENRDLFPGARVIDIASHDGRWSLAALKAGAAEVIGIEGREDLVSAADENLGHYCEDDGRYEFIAGDIFEIVSKSTFKADVVLCLGFLYHTLRYNELISRIREMGPRHLIVDTEVLPVNGPVVRLRRDAVELQQSAVQDPYSYGGKAVVGKPSIGALKFLLEAYDFEIERFSDWGSLLRDNPSLRNVGGYASGERVTVRCVSRI